MNVTGRSSQKKKTSFALNKSSEAFDNEMTAILRNNPPDVSRLTFVRRLLEEAISAGQ
jgi:hypothetical protein